MARAGDVIFEVLEGDEPGRLGQAVRQFIQVLIIVNVIAVVLETVESIRTLYQPFFTVFEDFSVAVFGAEYVARLAVCTRHERYASPILGRIRFALTPFMIFDLIAVAPFFIPFFTGMDMRVARTMRLMRIFRILKLARYSRAVHRLGLALRQSAAEIGVTLFAGSLILVVASACLFYVERDAQPDTFSSIPASAWWAIATLTTVGYGDISPITPLGKVIASGVAVLGVGVVALPAGILASAFAQTHVKEEERCPHCGERIER